MHPINGPWPRDWHHRHAVKCRDRFRSRALKVEMTSAINADMATRPRLAFTTLALVRMSTRHDFQASTSGARDRRNLVASASCRGEILNRRRGVPRSRHNRCIGHSENLTSGDHRRRACRKRLELDEAKPIGIFSLAASRRSALVIGRLGHRQKYS